MTEYTFETLTVTQSHSVLTVTMNHPPLNLLDRALMTANACGSFGEVLAEGVVRVELAS